MWHNPLIRGSLTCRTFLSTLALAALALHGQHLHAAKPPSAGGGPTCTISQPQNNPVSVATGGSVIFQGVISGGVAPYDVTWTFAGGSPASTNETVQNDGDQTQAHNVVYANSGSFTATLAATDSNGRKAKSCETSYTVEVGGTNNRPVAQNDNYNTTQEVTLVIPAPGVLGNDNDPDGDPMSAVLVAGTTHGSLNLAPDGGFSYTPDLGFTGSDSFSYTANDAGGASNIANVSIGVAGNNEVSINSTSANGALPASPVPEQAAAGNANYTLLAINDLGMHCGDLDTRISSILPPFNVLHAQVVERGVNGLPRVMGENEVALYYSAVSNPSDPAIGKVAGGQALSSVVNNEVYKTNFWEVAFQAYDAFYPPGILAAFYDPNDPAANVDIGLPVPDVELLYLGPDNIPNSGDEALHASQQAMPGMSSPYLANAPQRFEEHFDDYPFFLSFPFGYLADGVNWFEAAGVPIAAFDDFGRENPYPLVRVQATVNGQPPAQDGSNVMASLDTVMPISGEASCQTCHSADVGDGHAVAGLIDIAVASDDPQYQPGSETVPFEVAVEWASDINILRLHDLKHETTLESTYDPQTGRASDPVVCQRCHYTPALDLAQVGPNEVNGRAQLTQRSMSNVMHSHHAGVTDSNGVPLFQEMPPAIDGNGNRRDPVLTQTILEETCYLCHPGERTQCMRGAMANGGLVCQDCHGQLAQVGDDFSRNVTPGTPGEFLLAADFYTNPATPRVPWANEPGCGSCHTGYATDNLAGDPNVLVNPTDTLGNSDGIRLLAAYRQGDTKATPIVPSNKTFAENVVDAEDLPGHPDAVGNPKLYRVSKGHGGLFCESCHGSTHAEWPSGNPNANDNIPAGQLQGHSGYISECQVCHEPTDESLPLGNNGPHGMHAVVDLEPSNPDFLPDDRWNLKHRNYRNQGPGCNACHGDDLKGTVLSRTAEDRTVRCKDNKGSLPECAAGQPTAIIPKGTPVGCGLCHQQKR